MIDPQAKLYGLRFPEKDSKTKNDYMRLGFIEEDKQFLEDQKLKTITTKEMKKLPREVLTDTWDEDLSIYQAKRKP